MPKCLEKDGDSENEGSHMVGKTVVRTSVEFNKEELMMQGLKSNGKNGTHLHRDCLSAGP